jgi:hypothetical protein
MSILSHRPATVHANTWPSWTDEDVWSPTEDAAQWWADQNEEYHDLDHPTEAEYQAEQDPTDAEIDDLAEQAAWLDAYERGLLII